MNRKHSKELSLSYEKVEQENTFLAKVQQILPFGFDFEDSLEEECAKVHEVQ